MSTTNSMARFTEFLLPLEEQLERLRQHNATTWGERFSTTALRDLEICWDCPQSVDNLHILHVEGSTPGETVELLWAVIAATHKGAVRLDHVRAEAISLCNASLVKRYVPGIHPVRIDLTRYWFRKGGTSALAARKHAEVHGEKLAHGEALSAFAWHGELLRQMGRDFPSMRLAGYNLRGGGGVEVPNLWLHRENQTPRLDSVELDHVDTLDATPVILG